MDQQRLQAIFNDIPEAVLIIDSYGKIIFSNTSMSTLLGYDFSLLKNRSFFILLDQKSDYQIRTFVAFKDAFEKSTLKEQATLIDIHGDRIASKLTLNRIPYDNSHIFMVIIDKLSDDTKSTVIVEKDNMDQRDDHDMYLSETTHQQPLGGTPPELLILFNASLHIKYINNSSHHYLKLAPQKIIGASVQHFVHPEDHEKITSKVSMTSKGMVNLYLALRVKHEHTDYVSMEGYMDTYYDERGQLIYGLIRLKVAAPAQDADEENLLRLVADNTVLLQRKQFLETIYNYLPDAVLVLNTEHHRLIDFNQQAIYMFEAPDRRSLTENFTLNILVSDALHFLQQPKVNTSAVSEITYTTLKGRSFTGKTFLMDLTYNETEIRVIQISDITQQKELEAKLRRDKNLAEQMIKSQEEFLSTMSHEIRTPLNAVLGMTHLMLQSKPREDQKKFLQTLKFAGENLTNLINDILDHSKIEAGQLQLNLNDFNLKKFIQGMKLTYKNLANEKGLMFRLLLEEDLPVYLHGDVNRLGQILNNLLNNAVKFTKQGQIVMSVYIEEEREDQYVLLFEVQDTGIGIPADRQQIIFDPYQQASSKTASQYGGTGLGLSIVKHLVELQKGTLSLQSQEGQGSTFKVEIPFGKPKDLRQSHETDTDFMQEYQPLEGLSVLYVEDVIPNQLLMEGLCDNWKIDLDTALNGLEALEKVRKNHYDLILMDILMPEKNGYDTALEIRNLQDPHYENVPIIALSASVSDKTRQRIFASGMDDYLPKPIDPRNLHEKLAKFSKTAQKPALVTQDTAEETYAIQEPLEDKMDNPDFSQLRAIYQNDIPGYIRIIEQIRKLTIDSLTPLMSALQANDEATFRFICHKIMSYIKLLDLQRIEALINQAKACLKPDSIIPVEHLAVELERHFRNFVRETDKELARNQ